MHLILVKTPFGVQLEIVRDKGDTKKRQLELKRELPIFILKYGYFGEGLSIPEMISKWGDLYG